METNGGRLGGADNSPTLADLEEELKCALCLELFTEPRVLECQHTFCTICIMDYHKQMGLSADLSCPICRNSTQIPSGRVTNLPKNFYVSNIVDKLKHRRQLPVDSPAVTGGNWEIADKFEMDRHSKAPESDHYHVWTRLFNVAPANPSAPFGDFPAASSSSAPNSPVPAGFESLFPTWNTNNLDQSSSDPMQPSAPSFEDDSQPGLANPPFIMSSSSSLPPNSPAFTPSQSSSSVASSAAPAPSPSYIPSSAPPVSQPQLPVRRNTTAQQPQVQRAVIPTPQHQIIYHPASLVSERVPMLFNMWLQSLWFAPSDILTNTKLCSVDYVMMPYWVFDLRVQTQFQANVRLQRDDVMKENSLDGQQVRDYKNILCCGAPETLPSYYLLREGDHEWDVSFLNPETLAGTIWRGVKSIFGASETTSASKQTQKPPGAAVVDHVPWQLAYSRQGEAVVEQLERAAIEKHLTNSAQIKTILLNLRVKLTLLAQTPKLVYLPVFLCTYSYGNGDMFTLVVNGQSGKVHGDRPFSKVGKVVDFVSSFFKKK